MSNKTTFQLDISGAESVITDMSRGLVEQATKAIQSRANTIAGSMSSTAPSFTSDVKVGTIRRGRRAIGTVSASFNNPRESYIVHTALAKSKDAGRV